MQTNEAISQVLDLRTGGNDGRGVVADALGDGLTESFLQDITSLCHHAARLDVDRLDRQLGEAVRKHIHGYAERVAEFRHLI